MLTFFYWLLALFLINLGLFIFVLTHERRSMWAGLTLISGFSSRRFSNCRRH